MDTPGTNFTTANEAKAEIAKTIETGDATADEYNIDAIFDQTYAWYAAKQVFTQNADPEMFWEIVEDNRNKTLPTLTWHDAESWPANQPAPRGDETGCWLVLTLDGQTHMRWITFRNSDEWEDPKTWTNAENKLLEDYGLTRNQVTITQSYT